MNRSILQLAVPAIISNITVPLLGLVDLAIVGHMGSERYMAAVAVGSMIFNVMYWLMGFLRMSTSGQTAQAVGAKDSEAVLQQLHHSLTSAWSIALLLLVLQIPICWIGISVMHPEASIVPLVRTYFFICIWGAPAVLSLYALTGWFIGRQNTRIPMVVSIFQNVLNIVLSLLFVYVLKMKIEGVALGTMLASWGGALLAVRFTWKALRTDFQKNANALSSFSLRKLGGIFPRFTQTEGELFLRTVCLVAVNLFFTAAGAWQGNLIVAVNALLMTFFMLFSYFLDGFAYAAEALCGRYYGAGDKVMFTNVYHSLLWWGVGMIVTFTLVYAIGGIHFLSLLTNESNVIALAQDYFPWVLLIPLTGMAAFIYDGVFIGITAGEDMLKATALSTFIFFLIYYFLFPTMANHTLWLALIVYLTLRGVLLHFFLRVRLSRAFPSR